MKGQRLSRSSINRRSTSPERILPTPATSTATSWVNSSNSSLTSPTWNETFSCCPISEIDELDGLLVKLQSMAQPSKRTRRSLRTSSRPQMIQKSTPPTRNRPSSWPFNVNDSRKSLSADAFMTGLVDFYHRRLAFDEEFESLASLRLALRRQFPYAQAFDKIKSVRRKHLILQSETVDRIMNSIARVYAGSSLFDLQKQSEIVFCAWTTLLQYACAKRIPRDDQLPVLAVAATVLQAKLMDEADVNVESLLKKTGGLNEFTITAKEVKMWERRVSSALQYKILYPSPHILLFLFLDNLDAFVPVPLTTKLVVGLVLDNLMYSGTFRQMILDSPGRFNRIGLLVFGVVAEVLAYFYVERSSSFGGLSRRQLLAVLLGTLDDRVRDLLFPEGWRGDFASPEEILTPHESSLVAGAISKVRAEALSGGGYSCNLQSK